jgi:hypothetical protein
MFAMAKPAFNKPADRFGLAGIFFDMGKNDFETIADGLQVGAKVGDIQRMTFETEKIQIFAENGDVASAAVFFEQRYDAGVLKESKPVPGFVLFTGLCQFAGTINVNIGEPKKIIRMQAKLSFRI